MHLGGMAGMQTSPAVPECRENFEGCTDRGTGDEDSDHGDNAILSSDASKLKTINKLADAFAKQEDISSNEALTAATQEGLINALNDSEVVTLRVI